MKIKSKDKLTFKGCTWIEYGWEFDAPLIIYSPIQRYCFTGSVSKNSVYQKIEDICIDICCDNGEIENIKFNNNDLKEFKWRGWSLRFARRKRAIHLQVEVEFFDDDGFDGKELNFKILSLK